MRLINAWTFDLEEFDEDEVPEYAILSHTWEYGEVSYAEMQKPRAFSVKKKNGYGKIACAAKLALEDDLLWIWVDTCCIDKSSSAELQEAINSSTTSLLLKLDAIADSTSLNWFSVEVVQQRQSLLRFHI